MFTGIIEDKGKLIKRIKVDDDSYRLKIKSILVTNDVKIGDSIAVNGICLTITNIKDDIFEVEVMPETISRTSLAQVKEQSVVNLERALKLNDRLGGHIVSGHIDGTGKLISIVHDGIADIYTIETTSQISRYVVEKGSITIDGVSLTVLSVINNTFEVSLIPHTLETTNLSTKHVGDLVNLENDYLSKYIEKLL
ncbi:riboflavin synthase [Ligilactobacillus salivarius]|uniref:Riboflavin synthase n=1 Tax=Ligilactobacillus salivarius TaxID=1624 RepID=A0ABD7YY20_9LACO|nr:riboflavin synthase [Ligilactobacillus salivarius]WHS06927.1 riboflavin synthase [Ligilactobacillus salivarius]WHS08670.1 riboflavin synthase [Ligilactobacillus salivarius]WHS10889.1 riboflavin synthase [Ligilactobacillus salivarius]WHS14827.1 riboflavin synthase [Ligilactobacillus salivarius]WHS18274.1 riboflavin synthase [Ligilactobacillus salivarius]